jgi:hypothetical protein
MGMQIKNRISYAFISLLFIQQFTFSLAAVKKDSSKIDFNTAYNSSEGDKIVAKVGNKKITVREFLTSYEFGPSFAKREKNSKQIYLKYMIDEKLLALYGYSHGYGDSSRVKDLLSAIQGDLATDEMFDRDIYNKINISNLELDSAIAQKQISLQVKWLFAPIKDSLDFYVNGLHNGISFDSLFKEQLKDSVYSDERSMNTDAFKLRMQNPQMFDIVEKLKLGEVSTPIKGPDGWYIIKLVNIWHNVITTQSEMEKEKYDATEAIKLNKSDKESDIYVRKLMLKHNPVIQGRVFDILRSYLGNFLLPQNKFNEWDLEGRMSKELKYNDSLSVNQLGKLILVKLSDGDVTLDDFLNWYRLRDDYLKFNESSFNNFSASLEQTIWQMVRDHLLINEAQSRGFFDLPIVRQQSNWWKDKIIYSMIRDNLANSLGLDLELPSPRKAKNDDKLQQLMAKTFIILQELKKKYSIEINEKVLNRIQVQDSNDPRAVDFYIVKKGGTFPHPAYPSIDYTWQRWELEN